MVNAHLGAAIRVHAERALSDVGNSSYVGREAFIPALSAPFGQARTYVERALVGSGAYLLNGMLSLDRRESEMSSRRPRFR